MSDGDEDVRSGGSDIRAVDRAAQILALFGPHTPELTAAEAADRLDLNRTTAYRYCTSLVAAGLLERGQTQGSFVPGALLLQLGTFALGRQTVLELAPAHMRELCAVTRLTTVLSLWGSAGPIVSRVEEDSTRTVLVTVRVGTQLTLTSAQAKIFLAHTPDQLRVDRLVGGVPDDRRADLVAEIRGLAGTDRVAMSPDGFGVHAIAAPVFAEHGICAAIALIATDDLLPLDDSSTAATHLRETARALSKAMGAPPRPT
ncbi:helix-turn-helix domain-containing protein [Pseudonocardia nematodicida]|uniref:Helix-turn-helix domain-containing protein n=1 Tax=Pseudonocardia nematodicida TaxID=1206997 RepID=A0ABV1K6I9_9PSEU